MIKLLSKPKKTEQDQLILRKCIDRRAKNQVIKRYLSRIVTPSFYTLITKKQSNISTLFRKDPDQNGEMTVDGTVLLLLIAKQICPSSVSMIENIKNEAKALAIAQFNNDVSLALNKFEELNERIKSFGKSWDDAIPACFKLLYTVDDSQFITSVQFKENEFLSGKITELSDITNHAISIYTNLVAQKRWMIPDSKSVKIAALMSHVGKLESSIKQHNIFLANNNDNNNNGKG